MKYAKILAATLSASILAVIENLPVNANGFFLDATQMDNLENSITANETAAAELVQAKADLDAANAALATANTDLENTRAELEALKNSVPPPARTVKDVDETPEAKTDAKKYMTIYDSLV